MVELVVDKVTLDLFTDENIQFTNSFLKASELIGYLSAFTKEFSVPATANNKAVFKNFDRLDLVVLEENSPQKGIPAALIVEGLRIPGVLELGGATYENGRPESYTITFYSSLKSLKDDLSAIMLNNEDDADWSDYDAVVNYNHIRNGWEDPPAVSTQFPIIAKDTPWYYSKTSVDNPTADTVNAQIGRYETKDADEGKVVSGVKIGDLQPALQLKYMVETIFYWLGISVIWDSKIDATLTKLYIMLGNKSLKQVSDEKANDNNYMLVHNDSDFDLAAGWKTVEYDLIAKDDDNQMDTTTYQYTAGEGGKFNIDLWWSGERQPLAVWGPYSVAIHIDRGTGFNEEHKRKYGTWTSDNSASLHWSTKLSAGDKVMVWTRKAPATGWYKWKDGAAYFEVKKTDRFKYEEEYDMLLVDHMPGMDAYKFITGFLKAFNLVPVYDEELSTINFVDIESYYDQGNEVDWTKFADINKASMRKSAFPDEVILAHKNGEDYINLGFELEGNRKFGLLEVDLATDFGTGELKRESIFNTFPPSWMDEQDKEGNSLGPTSLPIHMQVGDTGSAISSDFLMYYYNDYRSVAFDPDDPDSIDPDKFPWYMQVGWEAFDNYPLVSVMNNFPYISQFQDYPTVSETRTAVYHIENSFNSTYAVQSLYELFYSKQFQRIYSPASKDVTMEAYLPVTEYMNVKLNTRPTIDGIEYIIKSIAYSFLDGKTQLKLQTYNNYEDFYILNSIASTGRVEYSCAYGNVCRTNLLPASILKTYNLDNKIDGYYMGGLTNGVTTQTGNLRLTGGGGGGGSLTRGDASVGTSVTDVWTFDMTTADTWTKIPIATPLTNTIENFIWDPATSQMQLNFSGSDSDMIWCTIAIRMSLDLEAKLGGVNTINIAHGIDTVATPNRDWESSEFTQDNRIINESFAPITYYWSGYIKNKNKVGIYMKATVAELIRGKSLSFSITGAK